MNGQAGRGGGWEGDQRPIPSFRICCGACAPECPVEAIFDEDDLPPEWERYREINARFFADRAPS